MEWLKHLLIHGKSGRLAKRTSRKQVICHNIISNNVSPQRSKTFVPQAPSELFQVSSRHNESMVAVLYLKRTRSIVFFGELKKSSFVIFDVRRHFFSKRQRRNGEICRNLQQLHLLFLELNCVATILRCEDGLTKIFHKKDKHRNWKKFQENSETKQSQRLVIYLQSSYLFEWQTWL